MLSGIAITLVKADETRSGAGLDTRALDILLWRTNIGPVVRHRSRGILPWKSSRRFLDVAELAQARENNPEHLSLRLLLRPLHVGSENNLTHKLHDRFIATLQK
jgi:hypothetical protein